MTDPIKAKIQELVPEVMELKFGCEVKHKKTEKVRDLTYVGPDGRGGLLVRINTRGAEHESSLPETALKRNWEILGSPITIAVVLRAIDAYSIDHDIDAAGAMGVRADAPNLAVFLVVEIINQWDKFKDNYDDQSEETKAFIGKLLGV